MLMYVMGICTMKIRNSANGSMARNGASVLQSLLCKASSLQCLTQQECRGITMRAVDQCKPYLIASLPHTNNLQTQSSVKERNEQHEFNSTAVHSLPPIVLFHSILAAGRASTEVRYVNCYH